MAARGGTVDVTDQTSSPDMAHVFYETHVAVTIYRIFPYFFLPVSTLGSLFTVILMQRKSMRSSPTSVYLTAMAIADAGTVYAIFFPKLAFPNAANTSDAVCKMSIFFTFTFGDIAVWILAATTVDRFIAVVFPLKAKYLCTVVRSCVVVVLTVFGAVAKNMHLFFTRGLTVSETTPPGGGANETVTSCGVLPAHKYFEQYIRPWLGLTLYAFIPCAVIFFCNISIIWKLHRMSKIGIRGQTSKRTSGENGGKLKPSSMTAMLLAISLMFFCMITPAIAIYVARNFWPMDPRSRARLFMAFALTDILVGINHSSNFILYVIAGRRFRKELFLMVGCGRNSVVHPHSANQSDVG